MSDSPIRRYLPFVAILLLQGFLVAFAAQGSNGPGNGLLTAGPSFDAGGAAPGFGSPGAADAVAGGANTPAGGAAGFGTGPAVGPAVGPAAGGSGAGVGASGSGGSAASPVVGLAPGARDAMGRPLEGDRSKCAGLLQEDITLQSPPCMPNLGGNNGATSMGVTADEIKVVLVFDEYDPAVQQVLAANELAMSEEQALEVLEIYSEFFNTRYEFHNRTMTVVPYYSNADDAIQERADAKEIKETLSPFAAVMYGQSLMGTAMADQLAREGIVSLGVGLIGDNFFTERHPFVWSGAIQGYRLHDMAADFWCKRMEGKNATLAGDPSMWTKERVLGVAASEDPDAQAMIDRLVMQITQGMCNTDPEKIFRYRAPESLEELAEKGPALMQRMKEDGVTTTFSTFAGGGCAAADSANYYPENYHAAELDDDYTARVLAGFCGSPAQYQNTFGIGMYPRNSPAETREFHKAAKAVNPDFDPPFIAEGPFQGLAFMARLIQYAGPTLTPYTLYEGSRSMPQIAGWMTPNPPWDGWVCCNEYAPEHYVGIDAGSYSSKTDSRQIYWSHSEPSENDGQPGSWVGVDNSKRYRVGHWTPGEPKQP